MIECTRQNQTKGSRTDTIMKRIGLIPLPAMLILIALALSITGCAQKNTVPLSSTEESTQAATTFTPVSPTEMAAPVSPVSSPSPPVSPLPTPIELPAELTGPLNEYTINNGLRADIIDLQFYHVYVWTGVTWDGNDYIWIVNNELKVIAGFNIETATNDRLVSLPIDMEKPPTVTGLTWDGTNFWVSDVSNGMIYRIDPTTGNRMGGFAYDGLPNGLDWEGDGLWVLSKDRLAIEKVTPSGERQQSFAIRGTWPTGLAWDGRYFWYSDANESTISLLNPVSGKSQKLDEISFMASRSTFNGLAWMNGYLWIVTEGDGRLHRFDVSQLDWTALDAALK